MSTINNSSSHEFLSFTPASHTTAKIRNNTVQRLGLLTRTIGGAASSRTLPVPRQIVNLPPIASKAMATLGAHEKKHKVTVVGSGNW